MGTPDFAVPSLEALVAADLRPVAVVTGPDRPRGRGQVLQPTAVKQAALAAGIEHILQPEDVKDPGFADQIRELKADVMVVVAFRILPEAVFSAARLGTFNLHGSVLPAYRGAAPINRAIMAGDTETGVTTFFLQQKVDTGNVILTRTMPIGPNETAGEVHDRMMMLGAEAVVETTQRILSGTAEATAQDDTLASPAPKIFRDDCEIDWTRPDEEVHNLVRGVSPVPGAFTFLGGKRLKVYRSERRQQSGAPGATLSVQDGWIVACGSGSIELIEVQAEGKQRMSGRDFVRGRQIGTDTTLGGR